MSAKARKQRDANLAVAPAHRLRSETIELLNLEPLNGCRRRTFPRVPLAVPSWNGETYRRILRCCFSGRVVDGPDLAQLKSQIIAVLGVEDALLFGSGSLALEMALRGCGVQPGDEVVLPAFCCSAVAAPVLAAGAIPVLADAGEELNLTVETTAAALTGKTKAIIVPHLFGNPADIEAIVELARPRNIRVIDDAAQALGATIDGRAVGSFGDAGVLSFGREKVCFGIGGGALVSRNKKLIGDGEQCALIVPPVHSTLKDCSLNLLWRRWRRWSAPLAQIFESFENSAPDTPPRRYRGETMANLKAAVAASLVKNLRDNITARRARVRAYQELLGGVARLELIAHRPGSACLTQVVRVLAKNRNDDSAVRVIGALGAAGYEIRGSYMPIHLLSPFYRCVWDRLPHTERVWADLIELPCEPSVEFNDIERITALVKRGVAID